MTRTATGPEGWRPLAAEDLPGLDALAAVVHPGFFERPEVMAERLALFAQGCLALPGRAGAERLSGYVLSHPARLGAPPPLDTLLGRLDPQADALYLHDIALGPECRGRGLAAEAIERILDLGRRYPAVMLISVYGTAPFWSRFGFSDETASARPEKLAPYGPYARYMVRRTEGFRPGVDEASATEVQEG
jgi:GNAT superfamily N-acetyltransferase